MLIDLSISPFDADVPAMVDLAEAAEAAGYSAVWLVDHFSGAVVGRSWSRDPFVCLAAIAARTRTIELGVMVANMRNRHPAQLACAVNSLHSIAPGRIRLGVGSGAVPGTRFAVEHEAIGTDLGSANQRRTMLADTIGALRAIWNGQPTFRADDVGFDGLAGVVDGSPCPPIVVGASAWPTIELALAHADGINVRQGDGLAELLVRIVEQRPADFEISVLDAFDDVVRDPARIAELEGAGVRRLVLGMAVPHDPSRLEQLAIERDR